VSEEAQFLINIEAQMKGGEAIGQLDKLEKGLKKTGGVTNWFANTSVFSMRRAVDHLGGPLGKALGHVFRFGEGLHKMAKQGGALGLATGGALVMAGAAVELGQSLVGAAAAVAKYAIGLADAARNQGLTLQAMLGSRTAADDLSNAFTGIEKSTGASEEHLMQLTGELEDADLSSADLSTALRTIATQEQAIGTGKTAQLVAQLKGGAVSANELANNIQKKFGGVVKEKMLGLGQQFGVLKTEAAGIFGGLKIEGFLTALQHMIGLLDENTSSGKALKFLFETVFQPLVNVATTLMPYVELAVLRFINTILRMYIAIKPTIRKVEELFHITPGQGIQTALTVGTVAAYAFAGAIGLVIAAFALVALPFIILGVAIYGVVKAIKKIPDAINAVPGLFHRAVHAIGAAFAAVPGLIGDAISAGIDFIKGLPGAVADIIVDVVNIFDAGIKALPDAVDAVVSAVSDAIDALPGVFSDIVSSISDVFSQIPTLLADGVDFVTGLPDKFSKVADDLIDGLVNGIKSGSAKVVTAVQNLGKDAVGAAKKVFHIGSPSKIFHGIGQWNAEGLAEGHEDAAPRVKSSIDTMTELPKTSPLRAGSRGRFGGGPVQFIFNITGGNAKEIASEVRREVENLLEDIAIELGAGAEATA
jgi:hypothetical protein